MGYRKIYTLNFTIAIILLTDSYFRLFSVVVSYAVCEIVNRYTVMNFLKLVTTVDVWLIKSSNSYRKLFHSLCLAMTVLVIFNSACYCMDFRIPPHVNSNSIRFVHFVLIFVGGFAMFHFIFSVLLLKGRIETLGKNLFQFTSLQEELTMAESVIHTQSSELSNADSGILHNTARRLPQNHITTVQQLDLHTSDTHFRVLSISKQCKVLRLRGIDNVWSEAAELMLSIYQVQVLMILVQILCLCAALKYLTIFLTCQLQNPSRWEILYMVLVLCTINLTRLMTVTASCHSATH
jgi:hypothetical protein